jgi:hypothetical protein
MRFAVQHAAAGQSAGSRAQRLPEVALWAWPADSTVALAASQLDQGTHQSMATEQLEALAAASRLDADCRPA